MVKIMRIINIFELKNKDYHEGTKALRSTMKSHNRV